MMSMVHEQNLQIARGSWRLVRRKVLESFCVWMKEFWIWSYSNLWGVRVREVHDTPTHQFYINSIFELNSIWSEDSHGGRGQAAYWWWMAAQSLHYSFAGAPNQPLHQWSQPPFRVACAYSGQLTSVGHWLSVLSEFLYGDTNEEYSLVLVHVFLFLKCSH